jgi:hypothetical protein
MPTIDKIARTINGPNEDKHIGAAKLAELQDLTWGRLKSQDQGALLRSARFIQKLFEEEPDGWVVMNGLGDKARTWDAGVAPWTQDLDKALWFARRDDAERFCADDEDAWHIRKVSDVRRMWTAPVVPQPVPDRSTGAPHVDSTGAGGIVTSECSAPLPAPALPVDPRSVEILLRQFRAFVIRNVTQWQLGAGDHGHPIWADVAQAVDGEDATFGPEWAYTSPRNRKPYVVLLEEYVSMMDAREAEERGG